MRKELGGVLLLIVCLLMAAPARAAVLWVVFEDADQVGTFDPVTNAEFGARIDVGNRPWNIALNAAETRAYVTYKSDSMVTVIDTVARMVITDVSLSNRAQGVAVLPDGSKVYICNRDETIDVLRTSDNTIIASIDVSGLSSSNDPHDIAITPDGKFAYFTTGFDNSDGDVGVIDTTTDMLVSAPDLEDICSTCWGIAINAAGTRAYVADRFDHEVEVIDTSTNSVDTTISDSAFDGPHGVCFSPDGAFAYFPDNDDDNMEVVRTSDNTLLTTIDFPSANEPWRCAACGGFIWVSDSSSGDRLQKISPTTNTLVQTITLAEGGTTGVACAPRQQGPGINVAPTLSPRTLVLATLILLAFAAFRLRAGQRR